MFEKFHAGARLRPAGAGALQSGRSQPAPGAARGPHEVAARMTFRVEVVCLHDVGEQRCSVLEIDRAQLALETLGMSIAEGKAILHGIQDFVAAQQVIEDLKRKRACPNCGQRYHSKDAGTHTVKTVFGPVEIESARNPGVKRPPVLDWSFES